MKIKRIDTLYDYDKELFKYTVYYSNDEKEEYYHYFNDNDSSFEIVSENKESNGYKLVKLKNNRFAYIRVSDNTIMPYQFDYATDFDKLGIAIIGNNGYVNFLTPDFNILEFRNGNQILYSDDFLNNNELFKKKHLNNEITGFHSITPFFDGDEPFALIGNSYKDYTLPINEKQELYQFHDYNDEDNKETIIPNNYHNLIIINNCIINPNENYNDIKIYVPFGIMFKYDELIEYATNNHLIEIVMNNSRKDYLDDSITFKYDKDKAKEYFENNIHFMVIDTGEVITQLELVRRIVSLEEFNNSFKNNIEKEKNKVLLKNKN